MYLSVPTANEAGEALKGHTLMHTCVSQVTPRGLRPHLAETLHTMHSALQAGTAMKNKTALNKIYRKF